MADWRPRPRLLVPEVIQTSAMDCGPASLKALLEGMGVPVSLGRLREACQTGLDGTSIDTMEDVAVQLGLDAEQVVLPRDHLLLPESRALPALAVVRHPNGATHFVVLWPGLFGRMQVMDPATGRQWRTPQSLLDELYTHEMPVPADAWREFAATDDFLAPLRAQVRRLRVDAASEARFVDDALADPSWHGLGSLDAATRMVGALQRSGALANGQEATRLLGSLLDRLRAAGPDTPEGRIAANPADEGWTPKIVPKDFWSVRPYAPGPDDVLDEAALMMSGAVIVRVRGMLNTGARRDSVAEGDQTADAETAEALSEPAAPRVLSPELAAALAEPPARPGIELWRALREDGLLRPGLIIGAMALSAAGTVIEALLFRAFFELSKTLALPIQRGVALLSVLVISGLLMVLELPILDGLLRLGRHVEIRLRVAFLEKIPRLGDRYFQSRPISDMAERSHAAQALRATPTLGAAVVRPLFALIFTVAGIAWLDLGVLPLAMLAAALAVAVPLVALPAIRERDLRFRTHQGALSRFYLDALLGLVAVRTHGAERAVRRQHEDLLSSWARAGYALQRVAIGVEGLEAVLGLGLAGLLVASHLARMGQESAVLLLVYWSLALPAYGAAIAAAIRQYPGMRNLTLRLLEPLGAPDETDGQTLTARRNDDAPASVELAGVTVRAGGHTILQGATLKVESGEHVAIVGPSGAGKSTLVGLLLGWHRPSEGALLVDGLPLEHETLARLRRETAWVDPAVQIWNRPFVDNLTYGNEPDQHQGEPQEALHFGSALQDADLAEVLERLPDGLQTPLGEGGGLLSGGQGQRVRLGRALLRASPRLVILDEPFRGLDRDRRRALLARSRERWRDATLLCVTHDVHETLGFTRVLVIDEGHVVEDGPPAALAAAPDSRYRALLDAEDAVREDLWGRPGWRRLWLDHGSVREREP